MFTTTSRSRRHRNAHQNDAQEQQQQPFFTKAAPGKKQAKTAHPFFQAKLTIGQPGDKYEKEADAVADTVVNSSGKPVVQRQAISSVQRLATPEEEKMPGTNDARMEEDKAVQTKPELQKMGAPEEEEPIQMAAEEEEEPIQMAAEEEEEPVQMAAQEEEEMPVQKMDSTMEEEIEAPEEQEPAETPAEEQEEEEPVQAKSENTTAARTSPKLGNRIESSHGNGKPMPAQTRAEMENAFGVNFSGVNVHTDQAAGEMNRELGAQAFTHGKDVYFNTGKYNPESSQGKRLLAHELTHVVQQGAVNQKGKNGALQKTQPKIQRGFFGKVWGGIKKGASWVGDKVSSGASSAWKGIKKGASWAGGKIASGAKAVWGGMKWLGGKIASGAKAVWSGVKWFGKQMWNKIKGIYYRAKRWITSLPSRLKRLFVHLWKGVKSFKPWSLSWWQSLGKVSTWKQFGAWLGEFAIYGLEVLGIGEFYETLMDFIKFNTRPLTSGEIAIAKSVFGDSIDYNLVRVDEYAILGPSWTDREYVSFHTINAWGPISPETLIHELTHVWQYQKIGAMYMPRAIHAQGTPEEYDYGGVKELNARVSGGLFAFNLEQMGDILSDYYALNNGIKPSSGSKDDSTGLDATAADLPSYEPYANQAKR